MRTTGCGIGIWAYNHRYFMTFVYIDQAPERTIPNLCIVTGTLNPFQVNRCVHNFLHTFRSYSMSVITGRHPRTLPISEIPPDAADAFAWTNFSRQGLSAAYGDTEPEYTLNMVTEANPTYERG